MSRRPGIGAVLAAVVAGAALLAACGSGPLAERDGAASSTELAGGGSPSASGSAAPPDLTAPRRGTPAPGRPSRTAATPPPGATAEVRRLFVGPERTACMGETAPPCLQVRLSDSGPYTDFAGGIAGFEHEAGFHYELEVARRPDVPGELALVREVRRWPAEPAGETQGLEGVRWQLVSYRGPAGEMIRPPEGVRAGVRLADGQTSGDAGCNSFGGSYSVEGEALDLRVEAVTQAMCGPEVMAVESAFLGGLEAAAAYLVVGPQLQLADESGRALLVLRAESGPPVEGGPAAGSGPDR